MKNSLNNDFEIVYLPVFFKDLKNTTDYISKTLKSPKAAHELLVSIEKAIITRSKMPLAFPEYDYQNIWDLTFYKINVKNYLIFYVVKDNVMEVHRLIHTKRDSNNFSL